MEKWLLPMGEMLPAMAAMIDLVMALDLNFSQVPAIKLSQMQKWVLPMREMVTALEVAYVVSPLKVQYINVGDYSQVPAIKLS